LGYPDDARLLLVNADDLGMYPAINQAIVRTFKEGIVRSTSLMTPCPGALQAMQLLKEHPEMRFGVHLSVVRDYDHAPWTPLTPQDQAPTLVDESGRLYTAARMAEMLGRARLDELEIEFRAQIEFVLAAGLAPTHLDWHCLANGGRADIFDMAFGLAREYGLALRVASEPYIGQLQGQGLPTNDHTMVDSTRIATADKPARLAQMLRELPEGLSEWAVHPSLGGAEAQALDPAIWDVRRADFDFLVSPQAREIIRQEGITLIGYEPIQKVWQSKLA
jgi:hypothetical protein